MLTINVGRKEAIFFGAVILVFILASIAIAFNSGAEPSLMGHSLTEAVHKLYKPLKPYIFDNVMYLKKGLSAIVATVLIVLITVATITIIWDAIIPMITDNVSFKDPNLRLDLVASEGYTTYDPKLNLSTIQVRRGSDKADLIGFDLIFLIEGNSVKHFVSDFPAPNQAKVFWDYRSLGIQVYS
jgi:hypothetical protein